VERERTPNLTSQSCFENCSIAGLDKPRTCPVNVISALIEPVPVLRAAAVEWSRDPALRLQATAENSHFFDAAGSNGFRYQLEKDEGIL
jgi:hypothetical protein